jgi:hypothetical protein
MVPAGNLTEGVGGAAGGEGALGWGRSGLMTSGGVGPFKIPSCENTGDADENIKLKIANPTIVVFAIEFLPAVLLYPHFYIGQTIPYRFDDLPIFLLLVKYF